MAGVDIVDRYSVESAFARLPHMDIHSSNSGMKQTAYMMHKLVHAWGEDRLEVEQQRLGMKP